MFFIPALHDMRAAASRAFWTAGSRMPIRTAMMAMTTSNSIRVKAATRRRSRKMAMGTPGKREVGMDHADYEVGSKRVVSGRRGMKTIIHASDAHLGGQGMPIT